MNMTGISKDAPQRGRCTGVSHVAQALDHSVSRVAPYATTVLITGPSGTGKELVARQIHEKSLRRDRLFIPVDCATMTGELMASQLFGHVKGAFTSADQGSLGCFRAANHGTIFLDEIGELPLALQSKLLRVIQERAVVPVGSHQAIPVDVRILAATNRDLRQEVQKGTFREDLYYRLSVATIRTTPLCQRVDDIPVLAEFFLAELESQGHPRHQLTPGAIELLENYSWPGNVRELKNVLEQAALETDGCWIEQETMLRFLRSAIETEPIHLQHFDPPIYEQRCVSKPNLDFTWPKLEDAERRLIIETLEHTYYNKSAAARLLAISRQALIRKIAKLAIPCARQPHDHGV